MANLDARFDDSLELFVEINGTGDPGASAYDVWLSLGNEGTEQDYLNSLKGDKGDTGLQGPQGIQGEVGPKGDTGDSAVFVGPLDPTNPDIEVWIDTDETPSTAENIPIVNEFNHFTSDNVEASLNELFDKSLLDGWELQNKTRKVKPLVTFVDDDGYTDVLTKLLPLSQTYNMPMVVAAISDRVVSTEYLTTMKQSDLLMLQGLGWEISSHTKSHVSLDTLTYAEKVSELQGSKEVLQGLGLNVSTVCYPFGSNSDDTTEIAREFYRCGRTTNIEDDINTTPLETFDIRGMSLGSYFDTWSTPPYPTNSLDYYKWKVDQAVSNNGWLVIITHCSDAQHTETQQQYLEQTIQYINSLNIEVVTLNEGLNRRGNIIDIGRYYTGNISPRNHLVVGCDGSYSGSGLKNIVTISINRLNSDPPKVFDVRKIDHSRVITANATGFPGYPTNISPGILTTDTTGKTVSADGFAYQTYKLSSTNEFYHRYEVDENTWSPWQVADVIKVIPKDSVTLETNGKTGYKPEYITKCRITTNLTSAPEGSAGMLTTDKTSAHDYYIYQTYEPTGNSNVYRRYWLQGTSTWGVWVRMTPLALTTTQRNASTLVRNVGDMVFDITLGKPVWLKTQPSVWVDATGTTV